MLAAVRSLARSHLRSSVTGIPHTRFPTLPLVPHVVAHVELSRLRSSSVRLRPRVIAHSICCVYRPPVLYGQNRKDQNRKDYHPPSLDTSAVLIQHIRAMPHYCKTVNHRIDAYCSHEATAAYLRGVSFARHSVWRTVQAGPDPSASREHTGTMAAHRYEASCAAAVCARRKRAVWAHACGILTTEVVATLDVRSLLSLIHI